MPLKALRISGARKSSVYSQIADAIREAVLSKELVPGEQLPAGAKLARQLGVNPLTVHRAYDLLAAQGLVEQKHGSGTYVLDAPAHRLQPTALGQPLESITIVVGESHLARCTRDALRLVTEMLEGLHGRLGPIPVTFAKSFDRPCLDHLKAGAAVLVKDAKRMDPSLVEAMHERNVPVLAVVNSPVNLPVPCVGFDSQRAAELACQHLLDCGYRSIGYIGSMGGEVALGAKFFAFANVLYRANLDFQVRHVRDVPNHPGLAYEATCNLVRSGDLPEAFYVDTDYKAMEVITALHKHGLNVPEDVAITSMDDVADAARFDPPLTTVRTPQCEIGQQVAEMLLAWVADRTPLRDLVLDSTLVVRATTICPTVADQAASERGDVVDASLH